MPVGGSRQQEWQNGSFEATTAAAGSALLSVGAASLRLVAGTISAGYNTISSAAAAGKSVATSTGAGQDGTFSSDKKEKVLWARFDTLDLAQRTGEAAGTREVLLLGYAVGFQVWDIQQPTEVTELLSLRDATVRCVCPLPAPLERDSDDSPLRLRRPVLAVVPCEGGGGKGVVELHSLRSQALAHILSFHSRVLSVCASARVIAVSLETQLHAFDAGAVQPLFTAVTYPAPGSFPSAHEGHQSTAPMALGHRWLAFASNQAVQHPSGPQMINGGGAMGGGGGGGAGANVGGAGTSSYYYKDLVKNVAAQAAVSSSKHLKAGLNWVGDTGYKLLSSQWSGKWASSDGDLVHGDRQLGKSPENGFADSMHAQVAGTVVVRDVVQRHTVAQFRAHTSPLSLLRWDPSGLLLVTASVYGHSLNVFKICPSSGDQNSGALHLYKLTRGLTPALISAASFSSNGPSAGAIATRFVLPTRSAAVSETGAPTHAEIYEEPPAIPTTILSEELLIAGPDGVLTCYRLMIAAEGSQNADEDTTFGSSPASMSSVEVESTCDSELAYDITTRLDLCRRPNWPERDSVTPGLLDRGAEPQEAVRSGSHPFPRLAASEKEQHEFVAQAELSHHPGRPPLWAAAPQFHFLELQPQGCRAAAPSMHSYDQSPSGLAHLRWVEELPARRVDVARGELLPSGPYWAGAADQMELPLSATARLANITLNPKAEDHGAAQVEAFEF